MGAVLRYGDTSPLVHSELWGVSLSKTGYLDAGGRCLVMVAGEQRVIVLLDSVGNRSPMDDAGRIRRWLKTGTGSEVSGPAEDYEREKAAVRQPVNEQPNPL